MQEARLGFQLVREIECLAEAGLRRRRFRLDRGHFIGAICLMLCTYLLSSALTRKSRCRSQRRFKTLCWVRVRIAACAMSKKGVMLVGSATGVWAYNLKLVKRFATTKRYFVQWINLHRLYSDELISTYG